MGDVVPTRTSDDDDPVSELKRIRPEAAPAYELGYEEARRALDGQERALTAFRTRAGVVLSAAAITTSFLGGQALTNHGFTTLSWIAIGAFAVLGVATLCVLWPDHDYRALSPEGMNLITSAGSAAEQTVFHLHLHSCRAGGGTASATSGQPIAVTPTLH
jgi:hypothetical protein